MANFLKYKDIEKQLRENKRYALLVMFIYALICAVLLFQGLRYRLLLILFFIFLLITIYLVFTYQKTLANKYVLVLKDAKQTKLLNDELRRASSRSKRSVITSKHLYVMQSALRLIYLIKIDDIKAYQITQGKRHIKLYVNDDIVKVTVRSLMTNDFIFTSELEKDVNKFLTTKIKNIEKYEG